MARKQTVAGNKEEWQEQLAQMMRADLIPNLHDQIILCLRDIHRLHGPEAFDKAAERILLEVSGIVTRARGRYRLDRMLFQVEATQDKTEMQDVAAVPISLPRRRSK